MSLFNFIITSKTNNKRSQDISSDEKINAFDIRIPFEIKIHILCYRGFELSGVRVIGGSSYRGFELSGVRVIGGSSYRGFELSGVRVIGIIYIYIYFTYFLYHCFYYFYCKFMKRILLYFGDQLKIN